MNNIFPKQRDRYLSDPELIVELEKCYQELLIHELILSYPDIEADFNESSALYPFWKKYAPRQRGYKPRCDAYPWGEVGEKVLEAYLYKIISKTFPDCRFIGLPYGHDVRFVTKDAFVHIDVKSTGPTDNPDEVVASPNQVSGDGYIIDGEGIHNSTVVVTGPSRSSEFQPELPPFYMIDGTPKLTLTYYLKCVYKVIEAGLQPLHHLELISVPNGMIMFDSLDLCKIPGLLTPGKDIRTSVHKRTRIKLNPLSRINNWRCQKIIREDEEVVVITR